MKIALIVANNLWFAPYVSIYTNLLDKWNIHYDVIYWNRSEDKINDHNVYSHTPKDGKLNKLSSLLYFRSFVKKRIEDGDYDRLILFGANIPILLYRLIIKRYSGKYILDFRDLGIEQNFLFSVIYRKLLKNSYSNVISSPGFKSYLPREFEYILSHNFDITNVKESLETNFRESSHDIIEVLTIGGIRDYESNVEVIRALSNDSNFKLSFIGKGYAQPLLQKYAEKHEVTNICFKGYYDKPKEKEYILDSSVINIHYPKIESHISALSNRFYNSLIFRRPMLVTDGGVQAWYAKKYGVGIIVSDEADIKTNILKWFETSNYDKYQKNCKILLQTFLDDYYKFETMLKSFISND